MEIHNGQRWARKRERKTARTYSMYEQINAEGVRVFGILLPHWWVNTQLMIENGYLHSMRALVTYKYADPHTLIHIIGRLRFRFYDSILILQNQIWFHFYFTFHSALSHADEENKIEINKIYDRSEWVISSLVLFFFASLEQIDA